MTSKLKAVDPKSAEPSKPKILIFGRPGVGKTWTSLDFPSVYYIDTEGGANLPHYTDKLKKSGGVYFGIEHGSQDFDAVINEIKTLATEKHNFKTVVIDSISHLMLLEIATQSEKMMKSGSDMTKTYGAEKKPAVAYSRQLINWLQKIDMNVILIAHEKNEWANDKLVGVTFDAWEKLEYILHLALNIRKQGPERKAFVRKSRLEMFPDGSLFDWSYEEFAKRYGKDVMESVSKPIVLATKDQLDTLNKLFETVRLPDGQQEKWLKAAGAENFSDVESEKVASLIDHINKTYLKGETK